MARRSIHKSDLEKMLAGYLLTTADILYYMPDHPGILQEFIWQEFDLMPKLPRLHKFLNYWIDTIEAPLHSVRIAIPSHKLIEKRELRWYGNEIRLN